VFNIIDRARPTATKTKKIAGISCSKLCGEKKLFMKQEEGKIATARQVTNLK
jgi:hypothetical protein